MIRLSVHLALWALFASNAFAQSIGGAFSNPADFELLIERAAERGFGQSARVRRMRDELLVQKLIDAQIDSKESAKPLSPKDTETYKKMHATELEMPEMRRASHVLLASHNEAEKMIAAIRGVDVSGFSKLAEERSLDTETKMRGGDLRYFSLKGIADGTGPAIDEALSKSAFSLKNLGDISPAPVPVGKKWSVVQLTGIRITSDETRNALLERKLRERSRRLAYEAYLKLLRSQYKVRAQPELILAVSPLQ